MSSEAVVYFPDTLASKSEVCGPAERAAEIPSDLLGEAQSQYELTEHVARATTQIPDVSDELLMEQVRQGTEEALSLIFRRHSRTVRNIAYRILRNEAEADDLV